MKIILASSSPRRRQLLAQIGVTYEVIVPDVDEKALFSSCINGDAPPSPRSLACRSALLKAREIYDKTDGDRLIIAADTIVTLGSEILGKPENEEEARTMLTKLSGSTHRVITGIALLCSCTSKDLVDSETTAVTFRKLSGREISHYIKSGEPMDKAGAYGIQGLGALLVKEIRGCYFNVVGLPLLCLSRLMKKAGIELL